MILIIFFIYIFYKMIVCNSLWDLYIGNDKKNSWIRRGEKHKNVHLPERDKGKEQFENEKTSDDFSEVFRFLVCF
ncbi:hypothetical protein [Bacillus cereus]|uniref:hypothetical protein n=1 Tax=Bacillus cereus TaxID=1396 RepID=UPI00187ABB04|nr:hypothetical protein [Bacillus cereus]MBE7122588.1 hypothetical protein [Bacillus cereus]